MTQASVGVPVVPTDVGQKAVDCETVVIGGVTYYRQKVGLCATNSQSGVSEEVWKDAYSGSIVQIEISHAAIHLGKYFSHSDMIDLANGANYDHLLVTPASGKYIHMRLFTFNTTSAPLDFYFYEETTYSAPGAVQAGMNFNRNGANATLSLYHSPTVTTVGTLISSGHAAGTKQAGGIGETSGTEWVLKAGTAYLVRVTNISGASAHIGFNMEWYEL